MIRLNLKIKYKNITEDKIPAAINQKYEILPSEMYRRIFPVKPALSGKPADDIRKI